MFEQVSIVGGIGGGAGAYRIGTAADQRGNLLGIDALILSPEVKVGTSDHPNGTKKKRFGATGVNHMFDYPHLAVKNAGGNGQAYKQSKAGYLPGNNGGGQAGYGAFDPHHAMYRPADDLEDAKAVAMREGHIMPHFVKPEHVQYKDRTSETLMERLQDMTEDYEREKIKKLYAQGYSDEEIKARIDRQRQLAIEQAESNPTPSSLLQATLARSMPDTFREDFGNTSVAPGGIARRQDASAYERALNQGNAVAMRKRMEAQRHEMRLRASGLPTEMEIATTSMVSAPETHAERTARLMREAAPRRPAAKPVEEERRAESAYIAEARRRAAEISRQEGILRAQLATISPGMKLPASPASSGYSSGVSSPGLYPPGPLPTGSDPRAAISSSGAAAPIPRSILAGEGMPGPTQIIRDLARSFEPSLGGIKEAKRSGRVKPGEPRGYF